MRKLKVKLCKSVKVAVEISGEKREIDLSEGDSINIDTVAYLVSEPSDYSRSFLNDEIIADALGEIVSNILKVDVNNEIARIASCSFLKLMGVISLALNQKKILFSLRKKETLLLSKDLLRLPGSINERGSVALGGNELISAQTYREKFFLYRIYEYESTGLFDLIALSDPLGTEFEIRYEINPFRSSKSHLWEVKEKDIS